MKDNLLRKIFKLRQNLAYNFCQLQWCPGLFLHYGKNGLASF